MVSVDGYPSKAITNGSRRGSSAAGVGGRAASSVSSTNGTCSGSNGRRPGTAVVPSTAYGRSVVTAKGRAPRSSASRSSSVPDAEGLASCRRPSLAGRGPTRTGATSSSSSASWPRTVVAQGTCGDASVPIRSAAFSGRNASSSSRLALRQGLASAPASAPGG